jgi:hypothetical protein
MPRNLVWRLVLIWGAGLGASAAQAQWPASDLSEDTLSVVVLGQAKGVPDQASITVELTLPAPSYQEGWQQISDQIAVLRGALEKAEIPEEAITVKSPVFVALPAFGPFGGMGGPEPGAGLMFQPPPPPPPGMGPGQRQVRAAVTVVLPLSQENLEASLERLDGVLQTLADAGHPGPKVAFSLRDSTALEAALMQDVMAKAKLQVTALAAALGVQVGPVKAAQTVDMAEIMGGYMQGLFAGLGNLMQMVGGILGGGEPANPREVSLSRMAIVSFKLVRPQ